MMWGGLILMTAVLGASDTDAALTAVPFTEVSITDAFWAPRLKTTREKTLPANFKWCEDTGRISNFAKAGGTMPGEFEGIYFNDSDVYKVIEGAAYLLHLQPDPELDEYLDGVIAKIASAQEDNGYLNTYYILKEPDKKWTDLRVRHELYCAGHLFEAAVAHYRATGKRSLLDVACGLADLIDSIFGPGKRQGVAGHEEIELGLVKLYQVTDEARYLRLAEYFVNARGNAEGRELYGDYCQDHIPIREQSEIVGHAVRAMYLYSGVADVARLTGDQELVEMMERIWRDVTLRKMYVTGGIGPSAHNEGFTVAYDLPNDSAYAETCAAIGMALWNHRLNLMHADGRYADVLERALYNGLLSGIGLDGEHFFYVNPLASRGSHHRQEWYGCACCPTNLVRFLPSLGGYLYAHAGDRVYVNLYVAGRGKVPIPGGTVELIQETTYPWDGRVKITVQPGAVSAFALYLRIPGWCEQHRVEVNGTATELPVEKGYVCIRRTWNAGDTVVLKLEMPVRRVYAHPKVEADVGRVALQRGPLVYCLEGVDNDGRVRNLVLPPDTVVRAEHRPDLLGGVTVLTGAALARQPESWRDALYQESPRPEEAAFVAVPYYAWDNRAPGPMVVWLPESVTLAEAPPVPSLENTGVTTASHVNDTLDALSDGLEPENSNDQAVPRFTWWDHKGTQEWVQYDFREPARVSGVEVYWFDDREGGGGCRVPVHWELLYKDGGEWKPVRGASGYGTERDQFNRVTFEPVTAEGLRLEVELRRKVSGGILEWRVLSE